MSVESELQARSNSACELCSATDNLGVYAIPPKSDGSAAQSIYCCATCSGQLDDASTVDPNHWRCLNDSMWNQEPAVQVMAWRMLTRLSAEGWPQDLLDMLYLEEDTLTWAKAAGDGEPAEGAIVHKDSNGTILEAGDSVVLIQTLNVKGSSLSAKRGSAVRNIRLVHDNAEHIEGKVEGQQIVILTKFVKKVK